MISVIIPTKNEAVNIGKVIKGIKQLPLGDFEIIVVDSQSEDKTADLARENEVIVYQIDSVGKGNAMKFGASKASKDILVFVDGDGSYPVESTPSLIEPIIKENKDVVYGSRFSDGFPQKMKPSRYFGNKILSLIASFIYRKKTTDLLTGFFAIRKNKFLEMDLKSNHFEIETEIFTKAVSSNFNIKEIPISYIQAKGSKLNPLNDSLKILLTLFKNWNAH